MTDKTYVLLDDVIAHIASCERSNMLPVECSAITLIKNIPVADVKPVVYCKDCKHRFNYDICVNRGDDWFCAAGKPKDGGQKNGVDISI